MGTELSRAKQYELGHVDLERLATKAEEFISAALADSTKRAYNHDFNTYQAWCDSAGVDALPSSPKVVALYIAAMDDAGLAVSTMDRALAAIAKAHEASGHPFDRKANEIKYAMSGVRRLRGVRPKQVDAITPEELKQLIQAESNTTMRGIRNKALMSFGFAGAFRRSELANLSVKDIWLDQDRGFRVLIRKSKTDQEGEGHEIGIPYGKSLETCPVHHMMNWLKIRGSKDGGPLFCKATKKTLDTTVPITGRLVARVIQAAQKRAGIDEERWFAGHSLRAGLATAAAREGKSITSIQATTRHKSADMVLRYIRREGVFNNNAAEGIGL